MSTPTFSVDAVCSHADLVTVIGSAELLENITPSSLAGETLVLRQRALDDVMRALRRRRPPIFAGDIADPTELREAVAFGTLAELYRAAITGDRDVHSVHFKVWSGRFTDEIAGMTITVSGGSDGAPFSIGVSRR